MKSNQKKRLVKPALFVVLAFIVLLIAALLAHNLANNKKKSIVTGGAYTKGEGLQPTPQSPSKSGSTTTNATSDGSQLGDQKSQTGSSATSATLLTPSGDFVSNHHPNLSGSPAPNTISSVCTSTPGATCVISFTKDGLTKSLASQTTDRGGSAFWNWKLQDIGLTEGTWAIRATASLNGQDKSANDALSLVVAP